MLLLLLLMLSYQAEISSHDLFPGQPELIQSRWFYYHDDTGAVLMTSIRDQQWELVKGINQVLS